MIPPAPNSVRMVIQNHGQRPIHKHVITSKPQSRMAFNMNDEWIGFGEQRCRFSNGAHRWMDTLKEVVKLMTFF